MCAILSKQRVLVFALKIYLAWRKSCECLSITIEDGTALANSAQDKGTPWNL